jgi:hypothetical protein
MALELPLMIISLDGRLYINGIAFFLYQTVLIYLLHEEKTNYQISNNPFPDSAVERCEPCYW